MALVSNRILDRALQLDAEPAPYWLGLFYEDGEREMRPMRVGTAPDDQGGHGVLVAEGAVLKTGTISTLAHLYRDPAGEDFVCKVSLTMNSVHVMAGTALRLDVPFVYGRAKPVTL